MAVMTRGNFAKFLWPGINAAYGTQYKEYAIEYKELFTVTPSQKAYEEDVGLTQMGLTPVKPEGMPILYDSMAQGFIKRYTMVSYGLGFIITWELFSDSQYQLTNQMLRKPKALAYSIRQTKETIHANVFNRAFNSSYTGGDGIELSSLVHPNAGGAGGTYQNELTTPSDLSEAALEQATIDIGRWTDDRGNKIRVLPRFLAIPPELEPDAYRILKSELRVGSANNDINYLRASGKFPQGIKVNHYFTDTDAWFIGTDCPDGFKSFEREKDNFDEDNDFHTKNAMYGATFRNAQGWTDPKCVYCSEGR